MRCGRTCIISLTCERAHGFCVPFFGRRRRAEPIKYLFWFRQVWKVRMHAPAYAWSLLECVLRTRKYLVNIPIPISQVCFGACMHCRIITITHKRGHIPRIKAFAMSTVFEMFFYAHHENCFIVLLHTIEHTHTSTHVHTSRGQLSQRCMHITIMICSVVLSADA